MQKAPAIMALVVNFPGVRAHESKCGTNFLRKTLFPILDAEEAAGSLTPGDALSYVILHKPLGVQSCITVDGSFKDS